MAFVWNCCNSYTLFFGPPFSRPGQSSPASDMMRPLKKYYPLSLRSVFRGTQPINVGSAAKLNHPLTGMFVSYVPVIASNLRGQDAINGITTMSAAYGSQNLDWSNLCTCAC
jgi:hypothetical protein